MCRTTSKKRKISIDHTLTGGFFIAFFWGGRGLTSDSESATFRAKSVENGTIMTSLVDCGIQS